MGFYFNTNSITPSGGSGGGSSGDAVWGGITGTLSNQTDLQTALNAKVNNTSLATVATTGAYSDLDGTPTIPTVNDATLTIIQGGQTIATFSANASQNVTADIQTSSSGGLENLAEQEGSLTILGKPTTNYMAVNIGKYSEAEEYRATSLGDSAKATGESSIALGTMSQATAKKAYQIGWGINNVPNTLAVGFGYDSNSQLINYELLDGTTGKIPSARLPNITIENKNTASGATNPLQFWEGTEQEYNTGGGQKDLYYAWENKTLSNISTSQTASSEGWWGIASGNGCIVITSGMKDYSPNNKAAYSEDDGDSWTIVDLPSSQLWRCACFGNGIFVVLGFNSNKGAYSEDNGRTWTEITLPVSDRWNAVAFNGQRFVAVAGFAGSNTTNAIYSDDGKQWNTITLPVSAYFASIACNGNTFVTAGGKYCVYSTDNAETWSYVLLDNNIAIDSYHCVLFGNNKFLIKPNSGIYVYYASDVTSWTPHLVSELPSTFYVGAYTNGYFYLVNSSGNSSNKGYYSLDGFDWISKDLINSQELRGVGVINNTFVIINNTSAYIEHFTASVNKYYTLEASPTTTSQVYSTPEVTSALTITSVDTDTITLSDTNIYTYNVNSNEYSYYTVGEIYPNYICLIEDVGIKKGSTFIAQINGTIDQSYIPTSTNAISGVGVAQALTRPTN